MEFDDIDNDEIDYNDTELYTEDFDNKIEINIELDNLFEAAQKEKNIEKKIKQYENKINYEISNSTDRNFSFKSFEQLSLIYLEKKDKKKFKLYF